MGARKGTSRARCFPALRSPFSASPCPQAASKNDCPHPGHQIQTPPCPETAEIFAACCVQELVPGKEANLKEAALVGDGGLSLTTASQCQQGSSGPLLPGAISHLHCSQWGLDSQAHCRGRRLCPTQLCPQSSMLFASQQTLRTAPGKQGVTTPILTTSRSS